MKSLAALIKELENKLPFIEKKKEAVSQVTVGWHLEHSFLALIKMISAVEHSNPADYKWNFNVKCFIVLWLGKIQEVSQSTRFCKTGCGNNMANIRVCWKKQNKK